MIVRLRTGLLIATPEESDAAELADWLRVHAGNAFRLREIKGGSAYFEALGPEDEACRVPINITSQSPAPFDAISNFAHTPFELDGAAYASVEGFWQGLKFPDQADRRRVAAMYGGEAKDAGRQAPEAETISYGGQTVIIGTWPHWQLMARACRAKFERNAMARQALLATGARPLVHQMRRDSRIIPGVIMAQIWTRVRQRLLRRTAEDSSHPGPEPAQERSQHA